MDKEKEELVEFLKNNLKLEYKKSGGEYGTHVFKEVILTLGDEEISSIFIED